ncbi:MAG: helix-turn-helix transcriptional regulator [Chloroflexi bacterium]|nr:helix-turn-helix transcriptional regulator [Chloroflexota bacterium]
MESLAAGRRRARAKKFNPKPFAARIDQLLAERNISMRQSGVDSGLDHESIRRMKAGDRPDMTYCILLADYFDINPNEFLQLADWPTLAAFDIKHASAENLPPEAVDVALDIAKIPDPGTRKEVAKAVRVLLKKYFAK